MRWEDERYVKFFTRDTPEFLALSWQARGLLGLVMRKLDRAGVLPVGKLGLRGVAVAIGGPWSEVEAPLRELLDDGCLLFHEDGARVFMPNFLEAQEANQSDLLRKRISRERARDSLASLHSVTSRDDGSQNVTESHAASHAVTDGHTRSQDVTPSLSDPIQAEERDPARARAEPVVRVVDGVTGEPVDLSSEAPRVAPPPPPELGALIVELAAEGDPFGLEMAELQAQGKPISGPRRDALRRILERRAKQADKPREERRGTGPPWGRPSPAMGKERGDWSMGKEV